jgi:hypothetical protein
MAFPAVSAPWRAEKVAECTAFVLFDAGAKHALEACLFNLEEAQREAPFHVGKVVFISTCNNLRCLKQINYQISVLTLCYDTRCCLVQASKKGLLCLAAALGSNYHSTNACNNIYIYIYIYTHAYTYIQTHTTALKSTGSLIIFLEKSFECLLFRARAERPAGEARHHDCMLHGIVTISLDTLPQV